MVFNLTVLTIEDAKALEHVSNCVRFQITPKLPVIDGG